MQWARRIFVPSFFGFVAFIFARSNEIRLSKEREYRVKLEAHSEFLEKNNQRLIGLNEALDGLVYTASHDLKAPVINMQGMISVLKSLQDSPDGDKMIPQVIDKLEFSSQRLLTTISDLLDISRVERSLSQEMEEIDVEPTVRNLLENFSQVIEDKQARIEIETSVVPRILFASQSFESILQNLISNALKYSRPEVPPLIKIETRLLQEGFEFIVTDNGQGIDLDQAGAKLFQMFTRFSNETEGNGVGLYIVKRSLEVFNADIRVESKLGEGTSFILKFPQSCIPGPKA